MGRVRRKIAVFLFVIVSATLGSAKFDYLNAGASARMKPNKVQDEMLGAVKELDKSAIKEGKPEKSVKDNELVSSFVDSYIEEHDLDISADLIFGIFEHLQKYSSLSFASTNLPKLFVQMGSFIDVLAALDKQTEDVDQIVQEQLKKLGDSGKGALHTLAENLKSELVRLMLNEPKKKSPPPPPPQKKNKKSGMDMSEMLRLGSKLLQGDSAGNIANLLGGEGAVKIASLLGGKGAGQIASLLGGGGMEKIASLLGGGGAEQIANLLGGKGAGQIASLLAGDGAGDIASLLSGDGAVNIASLIGGEGAGQIANLLGGKGVGQIANILGGKGAGQIASLLGGDMLSNLDPSKIDLLLKMAMDYASGTSWDSHVKGFGENYLKGSGMLQKLASSESGKRLFLAVPKIMSSKDLDSVFSILIEEIEWNWAKFFGHIDNNVYKKLVMYEMAGYIIEAQELFQNPPKGSWVTKIQPTLNSFLISRNMPLFDMEKPAQSISAIATKAMFVFGKKKINFEPYITSIFEAVQHAFHNKMKGIRFNEFSLEGKKEFIAESLDADIWLPLHNVWQTLERLGQSTPSCSSHLLCAVNQAEVLSGKEEGRRLVVEGASMTAAWILNQRHSKEAGKEKYGELYRASGYVWYGMYGAVQAGAKGEDCDEMFPSRDVSCNLVSWRSTGHMEL